MCVCVLTWLNSTKGGKRMKDREKRHHMPQKHFLLLVYFFCPQAPATTAHPSHLVSSCVRTIFIHPPNKPHFYSNKQSRTVHYHS